MNEETRKQPRIGSLHDLQLAMPRLLKEHGENDRLMLAAVANPVLALEAAGYEVTPEAAQEIEARARFGPEGAVAHAGLEKEIAAFLGALIVLTDGDAVASAVAKLLQHGAPTQAGGYGTQKPPVKVEDLLATLRIPLSKIPVSDPLAAYAEVHPVIPLLVRWRAMERRSPRFAGSEMFQRVLKGDVRLPVTQVRLTLQERDRRKARS